MLLVPARAVKTQGTTKTVQVQTGDKIETRAVQAGASNDTMVEITSGLQSGEKVVIPTTTTKTTTSSGGGLGGPGIGGPTGF